MSNMVRIVTLPLPFIYLLSTLLQAVILNIINSVTDLSSVVHLLG